MQLNWKKIFTTLLALAAAWLGVRYLLPVTMPFLLGGLLALAAEPGVRFLSGRLRLSRSAAAGIGVGTVFAVLVTLATLLLGLLLRQLPTLVGILPKIALTAWAVMQALNNLLT